ncbi:MAG: putative WhiB family transcriptional regulator [Acidimicrobiia bacterium]|nr:putative WhiB family transcriptional regulator [Acidimicrobiia bacterium]
MLTIDPVITEASERLIPARADWWVKARCRDGNGTLAHLFFSEDLHEIGRAKAICSKCPVSAQCLGEALERSELWGVWGGELLHNGRIVAHKRPRGRPPRQPREPMVIEEVPVNPAWRPTVRTA